MNEKNMTLQERGTHGLSGITRLKNIKFIIMKKKILFLLFIILHLSFAIEDCLCQWVQMSNGMGNNKIVNCLVSKGDNIFAGTSDSGVYLSTNYGTSWVKTSLNNKNVYSLAVSGNNIFAGTWYSGVYFSSNNGASWIQTELNNKFIYSLAISGNNIFAGTASDGVYLSTNNGINWIQTSLNSKNIYCLAINGNYPENPGQVIFAGTGLYGVLLSTNNGANWTQTALNNINVHSLAFSVYNPQDSGQVLYAGTMDDGVFLTSNNGINWIQTNLTYQYVTSLLISGNNPDNSGQVIIAGTLDYGVYISTNNGSNWIQKNQGFGFTPTIRTLCIVNNYIFTGTGVLYIGNSVWRRPLSDLIGIKKISMEVPSAFSLGQNYPNPFNQCTMFNVKCSMAGRVKVSVYDISGREVRTLVDEELKAGMYELRFDAGDLPSGAYFYQLRADKFTETKKLIILK